MIATAGGELLGLHQACDRIGLVLGLVFPEARANHDPAQPINYTLLLRVRACRHGRVLAAARGKSVDELARMVAEVRGRLAELGVPLRP